MRVSALCISVLLLYVCMCVCLSVCLSICLYVCLLVCGDARKDDICDLWGCLHICMHVCLSVFLRTCSPLHMDSLSALHVTDGFSLIYSSTAAKLLDIVRC